MANELNIEDIIRQAGSNISGDSLSLSQDYRNSILY